MWYLLIIILYELANDHETNSVYTDGLNANPDLTLDKQDNTVLSYLPECKHDFRALALQPFFACPVGSVVKNLNGNPRISYFDDLDAADCLKGGNSSSKTSPYSFTSKLAGSLFVSSYALQVLFEMRHMSPTTRRWSRFPLFLWSPICLLKAKNGVLELDVIIGERGKCSVTTMRWLICVVLFCIAGS